MTAPPDHDGVGPDRRPAAQQRAYRDHRLGARLRVPVEDDDVERTVPEGLEPREGREPGEALGRSPDDDCERTGDPRGLEARRGAPSVVPANSRGTSRRFGGRAGARHAVAPRPSVPDSSSERAPTARAGCSSHRRCASETGIDGSRPARPPRVRARALPPRGRATRPRSDRPRTLETVGRRRPPGAHSGRGPAPKPKGRPGGERCRGTRALQRVLRSSRGRPRGSPSRR